MKILYVIACIGSILFSCSGQQDVTQKKDNKESNNLNIDEYVENIKNQCLDSISWDIYESAEGGIISRYFKGVDTLITKVIFYGETGKREVTAYLKKEQPVYIVDIISHYDTHIDVNTNVKVVNRTQDEYYLDENKKLIKHLKNDTVVKLELDNDSLVKTLFSLLHYPE